MIYVIDIISDQIADEKLKSSNSVSSRIFCQKPFLTLKILYCSIILKYILKQNANINLCLKIDQSSVYNIESLVFIFTVKTLNLTSSY